MSQNEMPIQSQHLQLHQHHHGSSTCKTKTLIQCQHLHQHQNGSSTRKTKPPIQSHTIEKWEPLL